MKTNHILTTMLVCLGLVAIWSCSDDNGSNPTMRVPESFTLNTPATAKYTIDLAEMDSVILTWSQPDYGGMPLATTYYIQYGIDNTFSTTTDENGNETKNYVQADEPLTTCRGAIAVNDFNRQLMHLLNITAEGQVPSLQDVFFRISAKTYSSEAIYSNVVKISVSPYYQVLQAVDPIIWYLTGSCIGDGSWNNTVPTGCLPMYITQDNTYDETSGEGEILWSGYLTSGGFKFRGSPTDGWAVQIGQGDSFGEFKLNDGGSANISVPADGCYAVVLDTKTNTPTITAITDPVSTFTTIALAGTFNDWGDTDMTPVTTACENHDWFINIDLATGAEVKFKPGGTWSPNWGGTLTSLSNGFYGTGANNGPNLFISDGGNYNVYFNDILGTFRFEKTDN